MKECSFEERTDGIFWEDKARTIGEKAHFLPRDPRVTYGEMDENANPVSILLIHLRVKKRDEVCMVMVNGVEVPYSWFALAKI
jgi:acyl-coenzyme A synthetase/AMP-(fatty) acid ligase